MDENSNQAERDPWADMGNMSNSNPGELSEAAKENAEKWENAMSSDVPEYAGPFNPAEAENEPGRDESISDASAIINYGLNAASKQIGVEKTMETINFFVPNGEEDPINQLFKELGIDTAKEFEDLSETAGASKKDEDLFRQENVNAPTTAHNSTEGALKAIQDVKDLIQEVNSSPAYANLRAGAQSMGKSVFEYAVDKYAVRDLTVLFNALSEEKAKYNAPEPVLEETPDETPEENSEDNPEENPEEI